MATILFCRVVIKEPVGIPWLTIVVGGYPLFIPLMLCHFGVAERFGVAGLAS